MQWLKLAGMPMLYTLPALIAIFGLHDLSDYNHFVFGEGGIIVWRNVGVLVVALYLPFFLYGIGFFLKRVFFYKSIPEIDRSDEDLLLIFAGAGTVIVIGAIVAFLGFTYRWINGLIFSVVLIYVFSRDRSVLQRWLSYFAPKGEYRSIFRGLAVVATLLFFLILLTRGIHIEFFHADGFSLYFPYMAEIIRNGGTQMLLDQPLVSTFFQGRGRGLYIFFSSITDKAGSQVVSVIYLGLLALLGGKLVASLLTVSENKTYGQAAVRLAPIVMVIMILLAPEARPDAGSYIRYHLETGALSVCCLWSGVLVFRVNQGRVGALSNWMLPVVIALPIAFPQYAGLIVFFFGGLMLFSYVCRDKERAKVFFVWIVAACVSCAVSVLVNWLYMGIPVMVPYSIFQHLMIEGTWAQWIGRPGYEWFHLQMRPFPNRVDDLSFLPKALAHVYQETLNQVISSNGLLRVLPEKLYVFVPIAIVAIIIRRGFTRINLESFCLYAILIFCLQQNYFFDDGIAFSVNRSFRLFIDAVIVMSVLYCVVYFLKHRNIFRREGFRKYVHTSSVLLLFFYFGLLSFFYLLAGCPCDSMERLTWHMEIVPLIVMTVLVVYLLIFLDYFIKNIWQYVRMPSWLIAVVFIGVFARELSYQMYQDVAITVSSLGLFVMSILGVVVAVVLLDKRCEYFLRITTPRAINVSERATVTITLLAFLTFFANDLSVWAKARRGGGEVLGGLQFFVGYRGLSETQPLQSSLCEPVKTISKILPGPELVYFVNGVGFFSGCATTLLPRGKAVHHELSVIPKHFRSLVLRSVSESVETHKKLGIDYFGFRKDTSWMSGVGYSELFDRSNLRKYFDLFYSDKDMIILTWKNKGRSRLSWREIETISNLREAALFDENNEPSGGARIIQILKQRYP